MIGTIKDYKKFPVPSRRRKYRLLRIIKHFREYKKNKTNYFDIYKSSMSTLELLMRDFL